MKRRYAGIIILAAILAGAGMAKAFDVEIFLCESTGGRWIDDECIRVFTLEMTAVRGSEIYEIKFIPERIIVHGVKEEQNVYVGIYNKQSGSLWMFHEEALDIDSSVNSGHEEFKAVFTLWRQGGLLPCCRDIKIDPEGFSFYKLIEIMEPAGWNEFVGADLENFIIYFAFGAGPGELVSAGFTIVEN